MKKTIVEEMDNAVALLMDHESGRIPDSMAGLGIAATDSCVAIGTIHPMDGEASITLTDESPPSPDMGLALVFDGELNLSSREISVCSVANRRLASLSVGGNRCKVQVWANSGSDPDRVFILVGSCTDPAVRVSA